MGEGGFGGGGAVARLYGRVYGSVIALNPAAECADNLVRVVLFEAVDAVQIAPARC